jgi:hypothetical protein
VCDTHSHRGSGLCPSTGIKNQNTTFRTGSVSVLRWREEEAYSVGSLRKTQQSRRLPPFTWEWKQIHFPKPCVLVFNPGWWTKSGTASDYGIGGSVNYKLTGKLIFQFYAKEFSSRNFHTQTLPYIIWKAYIIDILPFTLRKQNISWRIVSSGMLRHVTLVRTDVSEDLAPPSSGCQESVN